MASKKLETKRSHPKTLKSSDPVREVIQQVRTAGIALGDLLRSMSAGDHASDDGQDSAVCLTVSRTKVSGLMLEFSTSSPGRRQTIKLLLIGDDAFLQIPGSEKLAKHIKQLARIDRTSTAQADRKVINKRATASIA